MTWGSASLPANVLMYMCVYHFLFLITVHKIVLLYLKYEKFVSMKVYVRSKNFSFRRDLNIFHFQKLLIIFFTFHNKSNNKVIKKITTKLYSEILKWKFMTRLKIFMF